MAPPALKAPNTIYLGGGDGPGGGGGYVRVDEYTTSVAATPGMLAEMHNVTGVPKWRPHSTAAGTFARKSFYIDRPEHNQGVDDAYVADELARIYTCYPGSVIWALVPSGANIVVDDLLESNGDGLLKEGSTAPVARALESVGAVTAQTRVRVEVL